MGISADLSFELGSDAVTSSRRRPILEDEARPHAAWLGRHEIMNGPLQTLFGVFAVLPLILIVAWWLVPSGMSYGEVLQKAGAVLVGDSSWVLTALLTLTIALYAVVIGEGIVDVDLALASALRTSMKALSRVLATLTLAWMLLCIPAAWGHPRYLPDLLGVIIVGSIAVTLAIGFPAFMFRPTPEVLVQFEAAEQRISDRLQAVPTTHSFPKRGWLGAGASTAASFVLGGIILLGLGARDIPLISLVAAVGSIAQTITAFLILTWTWADRPNRPWVWASYGLLLYFLVWTIYLYVSLFLTGSGWVALPFTVQLIAIALMVTLPARGPGWWRWLSLKRSAQRIATARLSRSLARQRLRTDEIRARLPVPEVPPEQFRFDLFRKRRRHTNAASE